jgi:hypothetical protein
MNRAVEIAALFGLRIATHRDANHPGVLPNRDDLTLVCETWRHLLSLLKCLSSGRFESQETSESRLEVKTVR